MKTTDQPGTRHEHDGAPSPARRPAATVLSMPARQTLSRRTFLTRSAVGTAAWIAGCDSTTVPAKVPASDLTFDPLRQSLQGDVLLPGGADYAAARRQFFTRFDDLRPKAVIPCRSAKDVQTVVTWARQAGVPIRIRSGGCSYAGYSTAAQVVVIDVRPMAAVNVDAPGHRVIVGAGATVIDLQTALWPYDLAVPTASGPTVGVAGMTLGGGYGLSARNFGLTCDTVLSIDIVLASGKLLTCSATKNTDLFWACRGGGGGNFGVVTSLTFRAVPVGDATSFSLRWPWSQAATVVDAWQRWAPQAPNALTATCHLFAGGNKGTEPTVRVGGGFIGTKAELKPLVADLLKFGSGAPTKQSSTTARYGKIARSWVDCDGILAHCRLIGDDPKGQVKRGDYRAKSDYAATLLPPQGIAAMLKSLEARATSAFSGGVLLDPYGGLLGSIPTNATAFVHRNQLFSLQYLANSDPAFTPTQQAVVDPWLLEFYAAMRPYVSGQQYQNYIDEDLPDWQTAYYGTNYDRLRAIKAEVDPTGFFTFPQAVGA